MSLELSIVVTMMALVIGYVFGNAVKNLPKKEELS